MDSFRKLFREHILASARLRVPLFLVWSVLAGLAIGYALPPKLFPGIEWIGLVPFFLIFLLPRTSAKGLFFYGWIAGMVSMGVYTAWFFEALPLTWLQLDPKSWLGPGLTFAAWLAVPVVIPGLWGGLFMVWARAILKNTVWDAFRLALLYAAAEYARTFAIAYEPFTIGTGNIYGDNWGTNIFAYAFADHYALRQIAAMGGIYALTFLAALPSALIFVWLRAAIARGNARIGMPWKSLALATTAMLLLFLGLAASGPNLAQRFSLPGKKIKIAIVSSSFFPEDWAQGKYRLQSANLFPRLIADAEHEKPDVILLPEGSTFASSTPRTILDYQPIIKKLLDPSRYQILINLFLTEDAAYGQSRPHTNNIALFDSQANLVGIYSKRFLMPFGEYMPYAFEWLWRAIGRADWYDRHVNDWRILSGHSSGVFETPLGTLGVLGCSEILSPYLARNTVNGGAEVLLYTASLSILRGSERLRAQNQAIMQIRSAETRRYLAYAANAGHSAFAGPDGTIIWESPEIEPGVKVVEAELNTGKTPAMRTEQWFGILAVLGLAGEAYRMRKKRPPLS